MALEEERRARERAESAAREARALADEREKRITAQDKELQDLRRQIESLRIDAARAPQAPQRSSRARSCTVLPSGTLDRSSGLLCPQASQNTRMVKAAAGKSSSVLPAAVMNPMVTSRGLAS